MSNVKVARPKYTVKRKTALVTGGAGFLGSHVAEWLVGDGVDVVVLDDLSGGFKDNVPSGSKFVNASITEYAFLNNLFEKYKFDYVYHLAAYAAEGLSHFIRRFNYDVNLMGSINLVNLCVLHKVKCFVFTSSIAVYGTGRAPMTEDMTPAPEDPYGISKYAVELDLEAAKRQFGLDYIVFRPHNVYGERQNIGDKYRNVVGIFMNNIIQNKPLTIFGDGEQTRAFTHADDVAPIIANCVGDPKMLGHVFNIGASKEYSVNHLAHEVAKAMGVKPVIKYLKIRNEVKHAFSSHKKLSSFGKASDTISLSHGIERMAEWAKKKGSRKSNDFQNIEIKKGLPDGW